MQRLRDFWPDESLNLSPLSHYQQPSAGSALLVTAALPSPPLPPYHLLYTTPPVDRGMEPFRVEQSPRKGLCLSTLGSRYEVGESSTTRPTREEFQDSTYDRRERIVGGQYGCGGGGLCFQRGLGSLDRIESRRFLKVLKTHRDHVYDHVTISRIHQTQLQLQSTLIQTQHQVHETRFQMQQAELAALRETDRRRQDQMVETLRVIRDMRREMSDMQAELLALREQQRRAGQPGPEARIPDHQDASGDADSHI
ncbi:hypothetical protein Tco_0560683 [Tanacetum coccineum]